MVVRGLNTLFQFAGYVTEVVSFQGPHVQAKVRRDKRRRLACPTCGHTMTQDRALEQQARDLPMGEKLTVWITYTAIRGRCSRCRTHHTFLPPGIQPHGRVTQRMMRYVSKLTQFMPVRRVAEVLDLSESTVRRWDKQCLEETLPPVQLDGLGILLVDEKHLGSSIGYVTLVYDLDRDDLLYLAKGKKKESLQGFFDTLDSVQKGGICCVGIDRAGQYKEVIEQNCPNADIIFDRFHLKKNLNDVVDDVRRQEWRAACKKEKGVIKGQRYNLLRASEKNTSAQKKSLRTLLNLNETLNTTYTITAAFDHLWEYDYMGCARRYLDTWIGWALESGVAPLKRFARSISKTKEEVLGFVKWRVTSGRLECFNAQLARIIRQACGVKDLGYLFLKARQKVLLSSGLQK